MKPNELTPPAAPLTLYGAQACPFAHRTRLVLLEKRLSYQLIEVDLANKPALLAAISPFGRVPVLEHGGHHVCESNVIAEYLEEISPEPALLPPTPRERARTRVWMDFANVSLFSSFKQVHAGATEDARAQARSELEVALARLEGEARRAAQGPYWFGAGPTLLDFTLYPVFEHWSALAQHGMSALPSALVWLRRWLSAMAQRASVRAAAAPVELYAQRYQHSPALRPPGARWPFGALG